MLARRPRGIVLSPGPGRPEDAGVCVPLFGPAAAIPVLGVCLGHQALGVAFGATVDRAPRLMHGKTSRVRHDGQGLFAGPAQSVRGDALPQPRGAGETLPAELEPLAWADDGTLMGLRHRELPYWGVQFHPESVLTEAGGRILDNFLAICRAGGDPSMSENAAGEALKRWMSRDSLSRSEMEALFGRLMDGESARSHKAALLVALAMKGETAEEIAGAAAAMRARVIADPAPRREGRRHLRHRRRRARHVQHLDRRRAGRRGRRCAGRQARQPLGVEPLGQRRRARRRWESIWRSSPTPPGARSTRSASRSSSRRCSTRRCAR